MAAAQVQPPSPPLDLTLAAHGTWAALVLVDPYCRIVQANAAAEAMIGARHGTLIGLRFCEAFGGLSAPSGPQHECLFVRALKGQERRSRPRWMDLHAGSVTTTALVGASTVWSGRRRVRSAPSPAGAIITMIPGSLVDEAERARREMIAAGLHELRHLITVQALSADLLGEQIGTDYPASVQTIAATLRRSIAYLMTYVDDLANRTLFDLGVVAIRPCVTELLPYVQHVVQRLEPVLQRRLQTVRLRIPPGLQVRADPAALEHVLVNLLYNAHKYSVEGDTFLIAARYLPQHAMTELIVRDHGPGIPRSERRRIFERFYRVPREDGKHGSGLGLAIVESIVARHGGTVGVRAGRAGGALFWIRMPLHVSQERDTSTPS